MGSRTAGPGCSVDTCVVCRGDLGNGGHPHSGRPAALSNMDGESLLN